MPLQTIPYPPYYKIISLPTPTTIKQYIALLTQAGTNPPTADILLNTLGFTPTWNYVFQGQYQTTADSKTPSLNMRVIAGGTYQANMWVAAFDNEDNSIVVRSGNFVTGTPTQQDDTLYITPIKIEVLN